MVMAEKKDWIRGRVTPDVKRVFESLVEDLDTTAEDLLKNMTLWLKGQPREIQKTVAVNFTPEEIEKASEWYRAGRVRSGAEEDRVAASAAREMQLEEDRAKRRPKGRGA